MAYVRRYPRRSALGADIDWGSVINNVVTTAGQVLRPGSASPTPIYTASPSRPTDWTPILIGGGLAAFLLFTKPGKRLLRG